MLISCEYDQIGIYWKIDGYGVAAIQIHLFFRKILGHSRRITEKNRDGVLQTIGTLVFLRLLPLWMADQFSSEDFSVSGSFY